MKGFRSTDRFWLSVLVILHLIISIVHGAAHAGANVPLSRAANLFVFTVIIAGPLGGLALMWAAPRAGALLTAMAMAAALAFGVLNHFAVASPDHVMHVAGRWRILFATTAILLALTEAASVSIGFRVADVMSYRSWTGERARE
jgi:hypothetical protein